MTDWVAYFSTHTAAFAVTAGLFGLVIGSFLNVVVYRLPIMLDRQWRHQCAELTGQEPPADATERFSLVTPRSRCPHCGHGITAFENIPLVSFLWLRGKCSACHKPIGWRYPLVETLTGVLSFAVAWRFGFTATALAALALTWALVALAFIDYDTQLLPDGITLPLVWLGLLVNLGGLLAPLPAAVVGAAAGYLFLWSVYQLFKLVTGKEGMGYGDFKLLAALGAWLGWQLLPLMILLASFIGAVLGLFMILALGRNRHRPIPFGPFLCAAGWVALLWGDDLTRYYLHLARLV
jgi:leader peptidase (prepilin peptidase)/N-methyltransferase